VPSVFQKYPHCLDALNCLTGAAYSDDTFFAYQYDAVGNREAMTTTTDVVTYTYDAANRLTSVGGETYTWDERGNLTHDGTFTTTYDAAGRLVGAQSITSTLVYTYNGDGVCVAQEVDGVEMRWVQDGCWATPGAHGDIGRGGDDLSTVTLDWHK
jgi:uncharacterized protein RhaS with RHS repeats